MNKKKLLNRSVFKHRIVATVLELILFIIIAGAGYKALLPLTQQLPKWAVFILFLFVYFLLDQYAINGIKKVLNTTQEKKESQLQHCVKKIHVASKMPDIQRILTDEVSEILALKTLVFSTQKPQIQIESLFEFNTREGRHFGWLKADSPHAKTVNQADLDLLKKFGQDIRITIENRLLQDAKAAQIDALKAAEDEVLELERATAINALKEAHVQELNTHIIKRIEADITAMQQDLKTLKIDTENTILARSIQTKMNTLKEYSKAYLISEKKKYGAGEC